jgi:hypothetical protein
MLGAQARCASDLSRHRQAAALYERSVHRSGSYLRNRAMRSAELAHARLGCRDVEGACEAADSAMFPNVASGHVQTVLGRFVQKLERFDTSAARDFLDRWRAQPQVPAVS